MMEDCYAILKEALGELNWKQREEKVDAIQENYENSRYFVAFVGQYSAGKSRLINNLLQRDILPMGVKETTPLLTYIRYGDFEKACLHNVDGSARELPVEEVSAIIQGSECWDISKLDYMEIFVRADLLRNGLILLDTPGINTVIERHEQLLATSLNLAARVVYVVGQAPHETDMEMLKALRETGMEIAYVRTHIDEIKRQEETPESVIIEERGLLTPYGIAASDCFYVSNLPNSDWYGNIQPLRDLLMQTGACVGEALERSKNLQFQKSSIACAGALWEKISVLEALTAGDETVRSAKIAESRCRLDQLENVIAEREHSFRRELTDCEQAMRGEIARNIDIYMDTAVEHIAKSKDVLDTVQMRLAMERETKTLFARINTDLNSIVSPILRDIQDGLRLAELSLDAELVPPIENYAELAHIQDCEAEHLITELNDIRENREAVEAKICQLMQSSPNIEILEELRSLERSIVEYQSEHDSLPPYIPQMIQAEDGKLKPSQVGKTIGNIADWALLLIPGGAISGAVKGAAESTNLVGKLAKVIGKSEKALKLIKDGDAVKDIAFALQNMTKTYATQSRIVKAEKIIGAVASGAEKSVKLKQSLSGGEKATSFFDYLTIQHWTEQIGKQFDKPPVMMIDKEYEQQYFAAKATIKNQLREQQEHAYQLKCQHQAFESEQARLAAEKKAAIVDEQRLQNELDKVKARIDETAKKEAALKWHRDCADWYREQISGQLSAILAQYLETVSQRLSLYQTKNIAAVRARLAEEQTAFEQLQSRHSSAEQDLLRVKQIYERIKGLIV